MLWVALLCLQATVFAPQSLGVSAGSLLPIFIRRSRRDTRALQIVSGMCDSREAPRGGSMESIQTRTADLLPVVENCGQPCNKLRPMGTFFHEEPPVE